MNAPLLPVLDRAILADLESFSSDKALLNNVIQAQLDYCFMDYSFQFDLNSDSLQSKQIQTEPGYFFVATSVSVQHDSPLQPPLIQINDRKKQKSFFTSNDLTQPGADSSATFGPGASPILAEGAAIYWPFGELANIEVQAIRPAGAAQTAVTVLVTGWKFPIPG